MNFRHLDYVIAQFFDVSTSPVFKVLSQGHINDTICFSAIGREYILQKINRDVFRTPEVLMQNMVTVAEYLQRNSDLPHILFPLFNKQGVCYAQDLEGAFWRVLPYIPNSYAPDVVTTIDQAEAAANMLGRFLAALKGLNTSRIQDTITGFHNSINRYAVFDQVVGRSSLDLRKKAGKSILAIRQYYPLFKEIQELSLPKWVVHNDPKISNVLFDQTSHEALCMIDWDTIMVGSILTDFGDMVRTACSSASEEEKDLDKISLRPDFFEACCKGFLPAVQHLLTEVEQNRLLDGVKWIVLEQTMRFLTDFLDDNHYYKTSYPDQNLFRANNQLALYRSILAQEQELHQIIQQNLVT